MQNKKTENFERMERKWTFSQKQIDLNQLIISIYKSPFRFSELYQPRQVNSPALIKISRVSMIIWME